jgi:hypothetical protein
MLKNFTATPMLKRFIETFLINNGRLVALARRRG